MVTETLPTRRVAVTARVDGKIVYYDIYSGGKDSVLLRAARFSELDHLQAALMQEAPHFKARLPAKTWGRMTHASFVESRRANIQQFFVCAVTDPVVPITNAFKQFFTGNGGRCNAETDPRLPSPISMFLGTGTTMEPDQPTEVVAGSDKKLIEESILEIKIGDPALEAELLQSLHEKKEALEKAQAAKADLENSIASGDISLNDTKDKCKLTVELAEEEVASLLDHQKSLQDYEVSWKGATMSRLDKEAEQNEAIARLDVEAAAASKATKDCRARFETARRARAEAVMKARADKDKCNEALTAALAANSSAKEHHRIMKATVDTLQEGVDARVAEASRAEVERETRVASAIAIEEEMNQSEAAKRKAEGDMKAAVAALAAHTADAARRSRAYRCEERRAEERAARAIALRDMATRGRIIKTDREQLSVAEENLHTTAESTIEAAEAAKERRREAEQADEEAGAKLQAQVSVTTKKFQQREHIAEKVAKRLEETNARKNNAVRIHACATAGVATLRAEQNQLKERVEGLLWAEVERSTQAVKTSEEALALAEQALETMTRFGTDSESLVLERQEATEASFVQALDEARLTAAEAKLDAQVVSMSSTKDEFEILEKLDIIVASSQAQCDDRARLADEAEASYQEALAALEQAQAELEHHEEQLALEGVDDLGNSVVDELLADSASAEVEVTAESRVRIVASCEARVLDLEQVVQEADAARVAAATAARVAREELDKLVSQKKSTPKPTHSLERLLQSEMGIGARLIEVHMKRKNDAIEEANRQEASWKDERANLTTRLHSATLQLAVAEEHVKAARQLCKSMRA